jgi:hypothetical protein
VTNVGIKTSAKMVHYLSARVDTAINEKSSSWMINILGFSFIGVILVRSENSALTEKEETSHWFTYMLPIHYQ